MKIIQDNTLTKITYEEPKELQEKIDDYLYENLAEEIPGAKFSAAFKRNAWDGMSHFYNKEDHTFATGFLKRVELILDKVRFKWEFSYDVIDNRPDAFATKDNIKKAFTLGKGDFKLRDYQEEAVNNIFESGHGGIVNYGVGSGKCVSADTMLLTPNGYVPVYAILNDANIDINGNYGEFVPDNEIYLLNRNLIPQKVDMITRNGVKELFRLTLENGNFEDVTANHPLLTWNGKDEVWKVAGSLTTNDRVCTVTKISEHSLNGTDFRNTYSLQLSQVKSIKSIGLHATFDVSLPTHSFIANGMINHNTAIGASAIKAILPSLQKGERIAMFTNNKEIFRQNKENLEKLLNTKVGYLGGGKKKMGKVMVCMIPTVYSYLKIDPESGLKLSPKEQQVKKLAKIYRDKFLNTSNPYNALASFVKLFRPIKKVDFKTKELLEDILYSCGSNQDVINAFNEKLEEYREIVNTKARELVKKKKFITDLLDSFVMSVADECLVPDTIIQTMSGGKRIKNISIGDTLERGGKVTAIKKTRGNLIKIRHRFGSITGSLTHPLLVEDHGQRVFKPMMMIKQSDSLLTPVNKSKLEDKDYFSSDEAKIAYLVGMLYADGTFLKNKGRRSNTIRVNVSHEEQYDWYRKVFFDGLNALSRVFLHSKQLNIVDKLDLRGNLLLRLTDKDVADVLDKVYALPCGKKSGVIKTPDIILNDFNLQVPFYSAILSCEGTVSKAKSPRVIVDMCSEDIVKELIMFLNQAGILATFNRKLGTEKHSDVYRASVGVDYFAKMGKLIPTDAPKHVEFTQHRFPARVTGKAGELIKSPISQIEYLEGEQDLYDLETQTHVFVADNVVSHNCHHSRADTWYNVLLSCRNAVYKVGLTGSIDTTDKLTMARLQGVFGGIVSKMKSKALIDKGLLAKPTIIMANIAEPRDISGLKVWQKIYSAGIVENDYRNNLIAGLAKQSYDKGRTALIIVSQIGHSDLISQKLEALQIPFEVINGTQEDDDRRDELKRVKEGHTRVLIATSVLDEGVDIANIDVLIMAAGGKSMRQAIQRVGRVLRKKHGKENKATIFDFYDDTNKILRKHSEERLDIYREQEYEIKIVGR